MNATIVKTLVYYSGPQLMLLTHHNSDIVAVAVDRDNTGYAFFACSVTSDHLSKYMDGESDLRTLFATASDYYFFDLFLATDNVVTLVPAGTEAHNDAYWPDPGFFASNH